MSSPGPELVRSPVEAAAATAVAPYHPPPAYPPPSLGRAAAVDGRAITSLAVAVVAIALGLPFGLPGLALGPVAYFTGKAAIARIDSSQGTTRGRGLAATGWVLGIVATAIGAVVSLAWLVVLLVTVSGPTP
ncbi:MAG TPA: hypothetical protein VGU71_22590 [Candidatus Dormibacteraeota bacterium]|nr:hypothetical protein [Candidatus Dormibacteraeota bacterium]